MNIFVYGPLLCPEIVKGLVGRDFERKDAILRDFKRSKIYKKRIATSYPAISQMEGAEVKGQLLLDVDLRSSQIFDLFEGDEYEVQEVSVESDMETYKALTYVWKKNIDMLDGEWSIGVFKSKYLFQYIHREIPEVIREFNRMN